MSSKIMVVDDEPDTVGLVTLVLESEGHEVIPAYNGKDALDMLNDTKPDLILLDIMMPDIDGWDVYRSIRKNNRSACYWRRRIYHQAVRQKRACRWREKASEREFGLIHSFLA